MTLRNPVLTLAAAFCLAACEPAVAPAERYPGPWQELDPYVAETMARKSDRLFQLCKTATMRPAFNKPGARNEYLVYCTFDRSEWWAFTVYTGMHEIIGPNNVYPDIPPPN
jgi:hypothetical protein